MRYYLAVLMAVVLLGAGCQLQPPQPVTPDQNNDSVVEKPNTNNKPDVVPVKDWEDDVVKDEDDQKENDSTEPWSDDATEEDIANIKEDQKNKEYPTNDRGREIINPMGELGDLGSNRIDFMLVSSTEPDPRQSEGPTFRFGCDEYLYPTTVNLEEEKDMSDLATAIVQLLTYKPDEDSTMINAVRAKGFSLANVKYEDGKRVIELESKDVATGGTCEDARIKAQIEETVAMYSDNFEIQLNGSAGEWKCLFDGSGLCG